jgi:hypothetical protein
VCRGRPPWAARDLPRVSRPRWICHGSHPSKNDGIYINGLVGTFTGNPPYLMGKYMVSCRWRFPKMGVPQNWWLIMVYFMELPIQMDD